tara:strand:+ start:109 stop:447 length:339 start_codon:yes stop_codon:yes gene_type:complete
VLKPVNIKAFDRAFNSRLHCAIHQPVESDQMPALNVVVFDILPYHYFKLLLVYIFTEEQTPLKESDVVLPSGLLLKLPKHLILYLRVYFSDLLYQAYHSFVRVHRRLLLEVL